MTRGDSSQARTNGGSSAARTDAQKGVPRAYASWSLGNGAAPSRMFNSLCSVSSS